MSRPGPLNVVPVEEPSWLDDLLNEPDTPFNKGHRRSVSDSFATLGLITGEDELGGKPPGFHLPHYFNHAPNNIPRSTTFQQPETMTDSNKQLAHSFSPMDPYRKTFGVGETANQGDDGSCPLQVSPAGTECSQINSSAVSSVPKSGVKRKQNNARRSRLKKLQYIAELERSVQALQAMPSADCSLHGVEASAQIEFLDQQNKLLVMENQALKQCLENLSQQHLVKSFEQERLGRLQYMYHMQQQQQQQQTMHPAVHRRSKSHDIDSQFAGLSLNPQEKTIANRNGFRNFPHSYGMYNQNSPVTGTEASTVLRSENGRNEWKSFQAYNDSSSNRQR